jgi:hypothetical protein
MKRLRIISMIPKCMTFAIVCSCSYIQLDLGQLKVSNEFSWHGGKESDPSAVRLDILNAEVRMWMQIQFCDYFQYIHLKCISIHENR